MENKQELFETMQSLWNDFEENHEDISKASDARARKSIGELKKLVTAYRKASVASNK